MPMTQRIVLAADHLSDRQRVATTLDALVNAVSWTADRRSAIATLRFVSKDGTKRIVAMERAVINPLDPRSRLDAAPAIANALRDAAITALGMALQHVNDSLVIEAMSRIEAFKTVVQTSAEMTARESGVFTAAAPWMDATADLIGNSDTTLRSLNLEEHDLQDLCPRVFTISNGDDGVLKDMSIGLYALQNVLVGIGDPVAALRGRAILSAPWTTP